MTDPQKAREARDALTRRRTEAAAALKTEQREVELAERELRRAKHHRDEAAWLVADLKREWDLMTAEDGF